MNFRFCIALAFVALFGVNTLASPQGPTPTAPRPRLVVIISVDQLATWLLNEAEPHLSEFGFRRLAKEGVRFSDCEFAHACTMTGPGHATLGTGADPSRHGIVGNSWFDPKRNESIYCCEDKSVRGIGSDSAESMSPLLLRIPTLADQMKIHFGAASRVVSVAWKDRSAILTAGRSADVSLWMDKKSGRWVSSTWYGESLPDWVTALNATQPLNAWFGATWARVKGIEAYADLTDDRPFEPADHEGRRVLPRTVNAGERQPNANYYSKLAVTPFGNEAVLRLALQALKEERLGQDDVPDFLFVGFSANDYVGHAYGPKSVEVRDMTLRTDLLVGELLTSLDMKVGAGRYALMLSADHGIPPAPEALSGLRVNAGRTDYMLAAAMEANRALTSTLGQPPKDHSRWVLNKDSTCLFLDTLALQKAGHDINIAADIAAGAVARLDQIEQALPVHLLTSAQGVIAPVFEAIARSVHGERSGHVYVTPKPYWLSGTSASTHGTPYPYDREVPLFILGGGETLAEHRGSAVTPGHGVTILSRALGIARPPFAPAWPPRGRGY